MRPFPCDDDMRCPECKREQPYICVREASPERILWICVLCSAVYVTAAPC